MKKKIETQKQKEKRLLDFIFGGINENYLENLVKPEDLHFLTRDKIEDRQLERVYGSKP